VAPFFRRLGADPAVQLVELDRLGRRGELIELEPMEVLGPTAARLEDAVDGAGVDVADVSSSLDRAAVGEALDDADDCRLGKLGVPEKGALPLGEAAFAGRAVQAADILVLAGPFDDREVGGVEAVEVRAFGVGAGEGGQRSDRLVVVSWGSRELKSHGQSPIPE